MSRIKKHSFLSCLSCLFLCLSGCGYHFGRGEIVDRYRSVCVPYVDGDSDGQFTSTLIRSVTMSGCLAYCNMGGDLALKVSLLPPQEVNIGFIYAPADEGDDNFTSIVVANEARLTLAASVTLIDRQTGNTLFGPTVIETWHDYDFEPDLSKVRFHAFALGQLEMHNQAQDAAASLLYTHLAEKIVDLVKNSW